MTLLPHADGNRWPALGFAPATRTSGCRSSADPRITGPRSLTGTNSRSVRAMISLMQAERLQPLDRSVGKAHHLDPKGAHDAGAAHLEPSREVEGRRSVDAPPPRLHGRERGRTLDPEIAADGIQGRGRDEAADDALALVGLQAVDPAGLVRQARQFALTVVRKYSAAQPSPAEVVVFGLYSQPIQPSYPSRSRASKRKG